MLYKLTIRTPDATRTEWAGSLAAAKGIAHQHPDADVSHVTLRRPTTIRALVAFLRHHTTPETEGDTP